MRNPPFHCRRIFVAFLATTQAMAEPCFQPSPSPLGFDSQVILSSMDIVESLQATGGSDDHCFATLTSKDKDFLKTLYVELAAACQPPSEGLEGSEADCLQAQGQTLHAAFVKYQAEAGTAASERVLTLLRAQIQKQQIEGALHFFADPNISPVFTDFSKSMARYERALAAAAHQDPRTGNSDSNWKAAKIRLRQWYEMTSDSIRESIQNRISPSNKFSSPGLRQEQELAAEDFLWKTIALNQSIKKMNLPAESEQRILQQVQALRDNMTDKTAQANRRYDETSSMIQMGAATIASAALIVASAGSIAPIFMAGAAGQVGTALAGGALSGAAGSAGMTGAVKVTEFVNIAKANADARSTHFVCELSRKVKNDGKDALDEVLKAAQNGAFFGVTSGGAFGVMGLAAIQLAPVVGVAASSKIMPLLGAVSTLQGGAQLIASEKQNLAELRGANQLLEKVRQEVEKGQASPGELEDASFENKLRLAQVKGHGVKDAAALAILATGVNRTIKTNGFRISNGFKYVHTARDFVQFHMPSHISRVEALGEVAMHTLSFPTIRFPTFRQYIKLHDIGKVSKSPQLAAKYKIPEFLKKMGISAKSMGEALSRFYGQDRFANQKTPEGRKATQVLKELIEKENSIDQGELHQFLKEQKLLNADGSMTREAEEMKAAEFIVDWVDRRSDPVAAEELGKGAAMTPASQLFDQPNQRPWFLQEMALPLKVLGGEKNLRKVFETIEANYAKATQGLSYNDFKEADVKHPLKADSENRQKPILNELGLAH